MQRVSIRKKLILLMISFLIMHLSSLVSAYSPEPVKIGLTLGLTGKYSEMSDQQMKGFKLWEKNINRRSGLHGRKVKIIIYDDKSDPDYARSLYEQLIQKDKVDLVFSPYSSEITEAIIPITEKYGYPLLISGASADRLFQKGYRYIFGVYTPASMYATGFLEMLVMNNLDKIAVVYADDTFSLDIAEGTRKWIDKFRMNLRFFEKFKKGMTDLSELAMRARASGADVLIVCGHLDEAINMRLSLKKTGWYPRAFFASVGPALQAYRDRLKEDANLTFTSSQWEHSGGLRLHGCDEFYNEYLKTYNKIPSYHAAMAFAAGQIIESAIKKAGGFDRHKITEILLRMDTISIIGRYGVDRTGRQIKHFNLTVQWQNGEKKVVWPEKISTSKPVFR